MKANPKIQPLWLKFLRWCARIIAILFVAFFLMMFIGEGSQSKGLQLGTCDYTLLSLYGFYLTGLIIGLWREGLGGLFSLVFLVIHIGILRMEGTGSVVFYIMLLPSKLYLLSWHFHREAARQQ